ncbi:MAG: ATP-binding cassette protein, partial [Gammaproteobacteria bacterium]|nr:ATP-binding cassette protein [Gammaproteobacteria bacterium]
MLGQALVKNPDIILLDEPTNHLEIEAIDWLEKFLKEFAGTVIFITHDRTFMQAIATRMVELDRGQLRSYPGNYQQYLDRKQHELEVEQTHNREFDKKLKQEEAWLRQGIKARRTRNEGRVRALEKLRAVRQSRREQMGTAKLQIQKGEQSGKLVIEAKNI